MSAERLSAAEARGLKQLGRLETLMDVIFAITIWHIFSVMPTPPEDTEQLSSRTFMLDNVGAFVIAGLAVAIVIAYWLQNNALFGNLARTDNRHTAIGVAQMFFLLVFLYSISISIAFPASPATRVGESVAAVLVGLTSVVGWYYARKDRRLLAPEISDADAAALQDRIFAEPLTALLTIPCAFVGPGAWELAWLAYPVIAGLLRRRRAAG